MYDLVIKNARIPTALLKHTDSMKTNGSAVLDKDSKEAVQSTPEIQAGEDIITDLYLEDGIISQIGRGLEAGYADILDAEEKYVLPGLIDMDCHACDPGYENREGIASVSKSAAKGGFTSITCHPHTKPAMDNSTTVSYLLSKARRESVVHVYPYGSMSRHCKGEQMAEIGEMVNAGIAAVTNAGCVPEDAVLLRNVLHYTRMFNIPVITVCHDPALAGDGVINLGAISNKLGLAGIPREAEETIVARNIILARYANARLHIAPVSTRGSVALIRQAKREGVRLTCGTCPHYFSLTEDAADGYNTLAKTLPPLRTQDDADAILEGLADGTIDVIASGHQPDTVEQVLCEFGRASYAISVMETAFPSAYTAAVASGVLSLAQLVEKMSANPADILSINGKGRMAEGYEGDLFLLDTSRTEPVNATQFASKAKFSPYHGKMMRCVITASIVNGRIVYLRD